jgi:hypothetical protein
VAAELPSTTTLQFHEHRLEALHVARDQPLLWQPSDQNQPIDGTDQGRWRRGDLVAAKVATDTPPSIAVFVRLLTAAPAVEGPTQGWGMAHYASEADWTIWNGDWAEPTGHLGAPLADWLAALPPMTYRVISPPGIPSTSHHTPWTLQRSDGAALDLEPRTVAWARILTAEPNPASTTAAFMAGMEAQAMNAALATQAPPGSLPIRWDPTQSMLLCPPDREPLKSELRQSALLEWGEFWCRQALLAPETPGPRPVPRPAPSSEPADRRRHR